MFNNKILKGNNCGLLKIKAENIMFANLYALVFEPSTTLSSKGFIAY